MKFEHFDERLIGVFDNAALVLLVFYYINTGADDYLTYCVGGLLLIGACYAYYTESSGKLWIFEVATLALLIYWYFFIGYNNFFLYWVLLCTVIATVLRIYFYIQLKKREKQRKNRKRKSRKK